MGLGIIVRINIEGEGEMGQEMIILPYLSLVFSSQWVNLPECIHIGLPGETCPEDLW